MEFECAHCGGRMLVEQIGGVVACPHCGTHLEVSSSFVAEDQSSVFAEEASANTGDTTHIGRSVGMPADSVLQTSLPLEPSAHRPTPEPIHPPNSDDSVPTRVASSPTTTSPTTTSPTTTSPPKVSKLFFVLIASYASAATLVIIILIINLLYARQHSLESLPDLKPPVHNGKTTFQLVPEKALMPQGHTLRLGQSQRFGSLRVTPLRVTRGPVEFVYFSGQAGHHRPPTLPALKLRLRFENISDDQTFAPLGRKLVLARAVGKRSSDHLLANNFIRRTDDKGGRRVLLFDLTENGDWDLRDQDVDHVLKPGEMLETYLASEVEGLKQLTGKLIWRVQFRKGYNPKSKRGVTTLIEVRFRSKEIQPDAAG